MFVCALSTERWPYHGRVLLARSSHAVSYHCRSCTASRVEQVLQAQQCCVPRPVLVLCACQLVSGGAWIGCYTNCVRMSNRRAASGGRLPEHHTWDGFVIRFKSRTLHCRMRHGRVPLPTPMPHGGAVAVLVLYAACACSGSGFSPLCLRSTRICVYSCQSLASGCD